MAIYTKDGNNLTAVFDKDGNALQYAYNKDGEQVYSLAKKPLKIMTYNVGQWYYGGHVAIPSAKDAEYYALQNGMLERNNPDILCLEEYLTQFSDTGRSALTMLQQYFPYIHEEYGTGTLSNGKGRCICSKYPITDYTEHQYTQSGSPRYFDTCTITVGDTPITVVVTHLNYSANDRSIRVNQLNELISYLQDKTYFISCGDYNTLDCKSTSGADYIAMIQPILDAGYKCANCTDFGFLETYSDQPVGTYTGCLDNIVTSSNISILSTYVDETKLHDDLTEKTDHMPLIAVIELP